MVNQDRKDKYIKERERDCTDIRHTISLFSKASSYEDECSSDICEWEYENLQKFFDDISTCRTSAGKNMLFILTPYIKWCADNGYKTTDAYKKIKINSINKMYEQMVKDPADLRDRLQNMYGNVDIGNIETHRVFFWLVFIGIPLDDIFEIREREVNIIDGFIDHNGTVYDIPEEALPAFKNILNMSTFLYMHENRRYCRIVDRAQGDILLRSYKTEKPNKRCFLNQVYAKEKNTGYRFNYDRLRLCGFFWRTLKSVDINNDKEISAAFKEIAKSEYRDGSENEENRRAHIVRMKNLYKKDFSNWYNTFYSDIEF